MQEIEQPIVLQGNRASKGSARGIGRYLTNRQILSGDYNFNDGDILLMTMTDPDAVPVMNISSAIVTEIGGRTCHAAIVARELHKPAIVALKTALDALCMSLKYLDGKDISVDGETGEVTIHVQ